MVTEKIKQLQALQAKASELQKSIETERTQELASLPERYGFDSLPAFIRAVKEATGGRARRGARGNRGAAAAAKPGRRRKRAKITPELKQQVKEAVEAGKTGAAIAKDLGISVPSVQNIKKELGLVKARGGA